MTSSAAKSSEAWCAPRTTMTSRRSWPTSRRTTSTRRPCIPARGFVGNEQVRSNWSQILRGVPDIRARVLAIHAEEDTVWSEWEMAGTRGDGSTHLMRGVIIFVVTDALIRAARFYLEPVDLESGPVDEVRAGHRGPRLRRRTSHDPGGRGHRHAGSEARRAPDRSWRPGPGPDTRPEAGRAPPRRCRAGRRRPSQRPDRSARRGASVVISAVHGFAGPTRTRPEAVDRDANARLVAAAKRAGVGHFVLVSVVGAAPDHPMSLHRMKYAAEQDLLHSGISATTVRSTSFLETWMGIIGAKLAAGGPALVLGPWPESDQLRLRRRRRRLRLPCGSRDPRTAQQLSVGGPENLTFTQIAEHLLARSAAVPGSGTSPCASFVPCPCWPRPIHPALARQAQAAVVMNTTDMTLDAAPVRDSFPEIECTSMAMLTQRGGLSR